MNNEELGPVYREEDTFRMGPPLRDLTDAEKSKMNIVKQTAMGMQDAILTMPASRERSAALTKLEEAVFWATKGITA